MARTKTTNPHTLGNIIGNMFDGVKICPKRGHIEGTPACVTAGKYWETFARHHEQMPVLFGVSGGMLYLYEDNPELLAEETILCGIALDVM